MINCLHKCHEFKRNKQRVDFKIMPLSVARSLYYSFVQSIHLQDGYSNIQFIWSFILGFFVCCSLQPYSMYMTTWKFVRKEESSLGFQNVQ